MSKSKEQQSSIETENKPVVALKSHAHLIAGGIGGMIGTICTNPLDVVKTRFQSDLYSNYSVKKTETSKYATNSSNSSRIPKKSVFFIAKRHVNETFLIIRQIVKLEGGRALFKGLGPNLIGVVPARSIGFFVYGNMKPIVAKRLFLDKDNSLVHIISAVTAGFATCTATNPIWLIKTRLQLDKQSVNSPRKYKNSLDCLAKVICEEGFAALYRGLSASYLGVSESVLHWVMYEKFKKIFYQRQIVNSQTGLNRVVDASGLMLSAGAAKLLAASIAYPHEVLRTRMRQDGGKEKYGSLVKCFQVILAKEGFPGLYGGLTAHLLRVVPNSAIMFGTYELVLKLFG